MKRLAVIGGWLRKLWPWPTVVGTIVVLLVLTGYSISVADGKPDDSELSVEYARGLEAGRSEGELNGQEEGEDRLQEVRENAYWKGWEEGYDEGEEGGFTEGRKLGAQLATPEDLDFATRYMVVYEPSQFGPTLDSYLEMPLNTLWECDDLDGCTEFLP